MQVGQERSGSQWVTYHGLGNDTPADMQVLIDGRAVYSPTTFTGIDWLALPVTIDEIERIEIVRGTNAVAYGPNAFLGVINIITRHAGESPGLRTTANVGSAHIGDLRLDWSGAAGDHALRIAGASRRDDGFAGLLDSSRMDTFSLRSDHQIADRDQLTLKLAGSQGDRQAGYADSPFNNNGERGWDSRTAIVQTQWRHTPSVGEELLVNFFRNESSVRDQWFAVGPRLDLLPVVQMAFVPLNRNRDTVSNSLELQHHVVTSPTTQFVWGGEARHERIEAPFLFHGNDAITNRLYRLFGNLEWRFAPDVTTNIGAMAEKYSDDRGRLSPRAFLNWQSSPDTTLRAGYSRAWRDRNLFERYGDVRAYDPADGRILVRPYLPNLSLLPPRIDSIELGYLARFRPGDTRLDVRLFNERITGFIIRLQQPNTPDNPVLAAFMPPTQFVNLDSLVTLRGIEYQVRTKLAPDTQLLFNHSLIDRRTDDPAVRQRVAPYTASVSWLQDWGGNWSSMVSLLRTGPLAGGDGLVPGYQYLAPAYTTLDASVSRRLRTGSQNIDVSLSAINLGPRHQEIADRSEQFLHPEGPINPVSRMVFLSVTISSH
jgi:iron complex outermembrane recepter protein